MDYVLIVIFTWGVVRYVTQTPRQLLQELAEDEGFVSARAA